MRPTTRPDVTGLLSDARQGGTEALDALFSVVYGELRALAQVHMHGSGEHTLSSTALVNEACIRLLGSVSAGSLNDRTHFFAVASRAMRQILVDHARARVAGKRGGRHAMLVTLGEDSVGETHDEERLIALHDALTALSRNSERLGRLVELRFFAGLNDAEIGAVLRISPRTVQRDWRTARAFLSRELEEDA
jgi:RNA polymerase sigma factor (TIGR02999 family)